MHCIDTLMKFCLPEMMIREKNLLDKFIARLAMLQSHLLKIVTSFNFSRRRSVYNRIKMPVCIYFTGNTIQLKRNLLIALIGVSNGNRADGNRL